jgi:hypothetical protein
LPGVGSKAPAMSTGRGHGPHGTVGPGWDQPILAIGETAVLLTLPRRPDVLSLAHELLPAGSVIGAEAEPGALPADIVEEWGLQSFPASDPPANW